MAKQLFSEGYKALHLSEVFSISKSSLYRKVHPLAKRREKSENEKIKAKIDEILMAHPYWGYRRVWAWLRRRQGLDLLATTALNPLQGGLWERQRRLI